MTSQDIVNEAQRQQDPNNASATLVNMKASLHIGESTTEAEAIYVEDSAKQAQPQVAIESKPKQS